MAVREMGLSVDQIKEQIKKDAKDEIDFWNNADKDYWNTDTKKQADNYKKLLDFVDKYDDDPNRALLKKHDLYQKDSKFTRMMLSRMQSDNDYYLGNGGRNERHLWAKNIDEQIDIMKALYNSLPEKERPDWITLEDIDIYKEQMKDKDSPYNGTREYLKKNTTMTNAQINEYIRNLKKKK